MTADRCDSCGAPNPGGHCAYCGTYYQTAPKHHADYYSQLINAQQSAFTDALGNPLSAMLGWTGRAW